jgi:RNA polymerase sigma factor (sigma-70 family)
VSIHQSKHPPQAPASPADSDFDEFFRRENVRAVRLAWLLTRSRAASEDIAQDVMFSVQRRFAELESPSAYLTRGIVNRCRSWSAADRRRHLLHARLMPRPEATAGQGEDYLLDAVAKLPYRQRVVIVARYWGDWTEAEIAHALGCRPGTVKSLTSRALARLRQEVER